MATGECPRPSNTQGPGTTGYRGREGRAEGSRRRSGRCRAMRFRGASEERDDRTSRDDPRAPGASRACPEGARAIVRRERPWRAVRLEQPLGDQRTRSGHAPRGQHHREPVQHGAGASGALPSSAVLLVVSDHTSSGESVAQLGGRRNRSVAHATRPWVRAPATPRARDIQPWHCVRVRGVRLRIVERVPPPHAGEVLVGPECIAGCGIRTA